MQQCKTSILRDLLNTNDLWHLVGMGGVAQALTAASVALLWAINGWWLGRRFEKEKEKGPAA